MSTSEIYDVVIVGAGIAGSIVAKELGQAGMRVLVLEAGPQAGHATSHLGPHDGSRDPGRARGQYMETFYKSSLKLPESAYPPGQGGNPGQQAVPRPTIEATFPFNISQDYDHDGELHNGGSIFRPEASYLLQKGPLAFASTYERIAGGTTWHWLGTSLRFLENDFKTQQVYGTTQGDWPLEVDELTPYYDRAESTIGVAADVGDQQEALGDQIKYTPDYQYPLQALPLSKVDQAVRDVVNGAEFHEASPDQQHRVTTPMMVTGTPAGRSSQPHYGPRRRSQCQGNTNCIPICPVGAKYDATETLFEAIGTGNVTVEPQRVATKILIGQEGQVSGVQYIPWTQDADKVPHAQSTETARGRVYVLAAHAIEIPKLLLMSADSRSGLEHGVANSSRLVGCNLMDHPLYLSWALSNPVYGFRGPLSTAGIETLRDGPFRAYRAPWRVEIGNEGWNFSAGDPWTTTLDLIDGHNASQLNPASPGGSPPKHLGRALARQLNDYFTRQWRMGFLVEQEPDTSNRVSLSTSETDALGLPRPVIKYDLSDYTKLGFVYAEIFARQVYHLTGSTCYTQNPQYVNRQPDDGHPVRNPTWFPMQPEWEQIFTRLPDELKQKQVTNLDDPHGVPDGFQFFGAGHVVGTCKMGSSSSTSVVNSDSRSWDHDNLFILGSAVFPTVTTANPTLTIAALAHRVADTIKTDLGS